MLSLMFLSLASALPSLSLSHFFFLPLNNDFIPFSLLPYVYVFIHSNRAKKNQLKKKIYITKTKTNKQQNKRHKIILLLLLLLLLFLEDGEQHIVGPSHPSLFTFLVFSNPGTFHCHFVFFTYAHHPSSRFPVSIQPAAPLDTSKPNPRFTPYQACHMFSAFSFISSFSFLFHFSHLLILLSTDT
uniref:Uncharacterized protein n=1 Tax=Trypanosoma vivax (strain Y486) TaxID=1055687 RepID=G0U4N0_TRYVY|nr:hypothetical protein TVY486_1014370 [Trypanosoma vivax Y486]